MNTLIQFIMKLLGLGGSGGLGGLIKDVLLKKAGAGGGNPLEMLMKQFQNKGLGNIFQSWVGKGANTLITPEQVQHGIGSEQMAVMAEKAKMPQDALAQKLAKYLPGLIDKMTPQGVLPKA